LTQSTPHKNYKRYPQDNHNKNILAIRQPIMKLLPGEHHGIKGIS